MKKIKLKELVSDKKNPRISYEEITELAESIQKNGQLQPMSVEDLKNGQYLITDGHRRKLAFELIKKKTNKEPLVNCIVENKISDDERLVKRAAIDAQTKNLSVEERDKLWEDIWKTKDFSHSDFAKMIGVPQAQVRHFLDRKNLNPSIKKLGVRPGILQETISLPEKQREKVLRYAAKTDIGAMGLRHQVRELKGASDVLVDAFTKQEIDIDIVKKLKGLNENKQAVAIANIVQGKKHIAKIPKIVKDTTVKPASDLDKKKINAQMFVDRLNDEISKTGTQMRLIKAVLEQIEEDDIEKYLKDSMKIGIAETLNSLVEDIQEGMDLIKETEKKWRGKDEA